MTFTFPRLGEIHPLRRGEAVRFGHAAGLSLSLLTMLALARSLETPPPLSFTNERGRRIELRPELSPEPISAPVKTIPSVAPVATAEFAVPDPVPFDPESFDHLAQFAAVVSPGTTSSPDPGSAPPTSSGENAAWNGGEDPSPDEFVPVDEPPVLIFLPQPEYPEFAQAAGLAAMVVIRALVGTQGAVTRVVVDRGEGAFAESAVAAAFAARFRPALHRGRPVAVWVAIPVKFELD